MKLKVYEILTINRTKKYTIVGYNFEHALQCFREDHKTLKINSAKFKADLDEYCLNNKNTCVYPYYLSCKICSIYNKCCLKGKV